MFGLFSVVLCELLTTNHQISSFVSVGALLESLHALPRVSWWNLSSKTLWRRFKLFPLDV